MLRFGSLPVQRVIKDKSKLKVSMKLSDAGWPIHFDDNELKVLWTLADDKGYSADEIADILKEKGRYQIVKSESLTDEKDKNHGNLSAVLKRLHNHNIINYEKRKVRSSKAKRDYLVKFYHINPMCYDIIRNIAHNRKDEAERECFRAYEADKGCCQDDVYKKICKKEDLYEVVELMFKNMIDDFNREYNESLETLKEGDPVVSMSWSPALAELISIAKLIEPHCKSRLDAELAAFKLYPDLVEADREWQRTYGYVSEASKKLHEASLGQTRQVIGKDILLRE